MKKTIKSLSILLTVIIAFSYLCINVGASSKYKIDKYGELYYYKGSSTVEIKSKVSAVDSFVFDDIDVKQFTVSGSNDYFAVKNGVLYNKSFTILVRCPTLYKGSFSVPSTVKTIMSHAFYNCTNISEIYMGDNVKSISEYAFYNCKKMGKIRLSTSLNSLKASTFINCKKLESIEIPKNVQKIGANCFEGCKKLKELNISDKVTSIGERAFYNCLGIESIRLPKSLEAIRSYTFYNCTNLQKINLPSSLKTIDYYAFYKCSSLQRVDIPNSVFSVGMSAFENCESLKTVTLSTQMDEIRPYTFEDCINLETVNNTKNITDYKCNCFNNCVKLKNIELGQKTERIQEKAFKNCKSISSISIPASVVKIYNGAFVGVTVNLNVDKSNSYYTDVDGIIYNKKMTRLVAVPSNKTGNYAMPQTILYVNSRAFRSTNYSSITFSDKVKTVNKSYFNGCEKLKKLNLPAQLNNLYSYYYSYYSKCDSLKEINIADTNKKFKSIDGILYNKNVTSIMYFPNSKTGSITLPETLKSVNYEVLNNKLSNVNISENNKYFSSKDGVLYSKNFKYIRIIPNKKTTVTLPKTICKINYLFNSKEYSNLKNVTIENENRFFGSKNGVVYNKNINKLLYIPAKKSGIYKMPSNVTKISWGAFKNSNKLKRVIINKKLSVSGDYTFSFENCTSLTSITFKTGSFSKLNVDLYNCNNLKLIDLPSSIMKVNMWYMPEKVTVKGYENTGARECTEGANGKFIQKGVLLNKVSKLKIKKIVNKYEISWNELKGADGYQVYTSNKILKNLSGNDNTKWSLSNIYQYGGEKIYVRGYVKSGKDKIYGRAKGYYVSYNW